MTASDSHRTDGRFDEDAQIAHLRDAFASCDPIRVVAGLMEVQQARGQLSPDLAPFAASGDIDFYTLWAVMRSLKISLLVETVKPVSL